MPEQMAADWVPRLIAWADVHQPDAARQTRAVAHRPETYARYLARLDELWFEWAARAWAGWSPERRREHHLRAEGLVRQGCSPREAERQTFLEMDGQKADAA